MANLTERLVFLPRSPKNSTLARCTRPAMVLSCLVPRDRAHRGLDGDRQAAGDRRRTCVQAGAQRRMAARRLLCFAMQRPLRRRKIAAGPPLRQRRSRRQPSCGQIRPSRGGMGAAREGQGSWRGSSATRIHSTSEFSRADRRVSARHATAAMPAPSRATRRADPASHHGQQRTAAHRQVAAATGVPPALGLSSRSRARPAW